MTSSSGSSLALGSHWDSPNAYPTICYCDKDVFSMDVYGSFRRIPTEILKKLVISIHSCTTAWVDGLEMAYRAYDIWYTTTWELHHLFWHRHVFSPNFPPAPALSGSFLVAGKCPNLYDQKPSLVLVRQKQPSMLLRAISTWAVGASTEIGPLDPHGLLEKSWGSKPKLQLKRHHQ